MRVAKLLSAVLIAFIPLAGICAQELAEEEIRGVARGDIEFQNYEGPHAKIETAEEIRSIGESLSAALTEETREAGYFTKYRIRSIAPREDSELYGADVFSLGEDAAVDHIDNIRRILSGYIQRKFGYDREESETIAVFLTYYNAVHRGDMEYIEQTYHSGVVEVIDPERAGIATRYSEWPGKTQMLIPLRRVGDREALSTDTVGEEEVVEEMRQQEEDRGVDERKEMVEIRDEELDEEQEATDEAGEELEEQEQVVEEKEQEVAEAEEELEEAREEQGEESREAQEAEERLQDAEQELAEEQERQEQQREDIEEQEREQEERREAIQEERERIADDQQELIEEQAAGEDTAEAEAETGTEEVSGQAESATEVPETTPFIIYQKGDEVFGRLVEIEKRNGRIRRRAQLNTVRSKDMVRSQNGVVVVAGTDDPPRAVRLVELDTESLEVSGQSAEDIYAGSSLSERNGSIYAVTKHEESWYVGRFRSGLSLAARSDAEVAPQTMFLFEEGTLYVQARDGDVVLLDPGTLQRLAEE